MCQSYSNQRWDVFETRCRLRLKMPRKAGCETVVQRRSQYKILAIPSGPSILSRLSLLSQSHPFIALSCSERFRSQIST